MKYLIRSIKYFFYFALLTTLFLSLFVISGTVEGNIESMFEGGYDALWKIAMIFAVAAGVYPKLGFIRREVSCQGDWNEISGIVTEFFNGHHFQTETRSDNGMTFRYKGFAGRLSRMYEDRITLTRTEEGFELEGLRKDVLRMAMTLEYRLNPQDGDQGN